jgi:hypothetical protein
MPKWGSFDIETFRPIYETGSINKNGLNLILLGAKKMKLQKIFSQNICMCL